MAVQAGGARRSGHPPSSLPDPSHLYVRPSRLKRAGGRARVHAIGKGQTGLLICTESHERVARGRERCLMGAKARLFTPIHARSLCAWLAILSSRPRRSATAISSILIPPRSRVSSRSTVVALWSRFASCHLPCCLPAVGSV